METTKKQFHSTEQWKELREKAEYIGYSVLHDGTGGQYTVRDNENKVIAKRTDADHAFRIIEFAYNIRHGKQLRITKGEWKNTVRGIMSDKGLLIAQCWYGNQNDSFGRLPAVPSHEEFCANGNLIANAPKLLKSLCDVVKLLEIYSNSTEPSLNGEGVDAEIFREAKEVLKNIVK